ncbi:MAG: hypothetical protein HY791_22410 [Deltaproteobacteria bacterium]|nr:hypothetical protein [Deltaproteobacteria bacterium]
MISETQGPDDVGAHPAPELGLEVGPDPHALDELEAHVEDQLTALGSSAEPNDFDELHAWARQHAIERRLSLKAPPIDPSEGRSSAFGILCLLDSLRGQPLRSFATARAGYAFDEQALVLPAFATQIAAPDAALFEDLWTVDAAVLRGSTPIDRALAWLESPGRRIIEDISVLAESPGKRIGPTDWTLDRIYLAAGATDPRPDAAGWRELHDAVPGGRYRRWTPAKDAELRALQVFEHGEPVSLRGAALRWLIDHAGRDAERLVVLRKALEALDESAPDELGLRCLSHAVWLTAGDKAPGRVQRVWDVALWLERSLCLSPYYGQDRAALTARIASLQHRLGLASTTTQTAEAGVLGTIEETGILAAVALCVDATAMHPTPLALVERLRSITGVQTVHQLALAPTAARCLEELEWPRTAEATLDAVPAYAAAQLMTELKLDWLTKASPEVRSERFALLAQPDRRWWLARALYVERHGLTSADREILVTWWTEQASKADRGEATEKRLLATVASAITPALTDEQLRVALALALGSDGRWPAFILDAYAESAISSGRLEAAALSLEALESVANGTTERKPTDEDKLNAGLFALRRLSAAPAMPGHAARLRRLVGLFEHPPFRQHVGLRRELLRLKLVRPREEA